MPRPVSPALPRAFAALSVALCCAVPAAGQTLRSCDTFEANARNLMSPPEVAVQSFAEGEVRIIGLDTIEPACCYAHLLVTHPVPDEPYPACTLISDTGGVGFAGVDMGALTSSYDPVDGLVVTVPVGKYDGQASIMSPLTVTVDGPTGQVTASR